MKIIYGDNSSGSTKIVIDTNKANTRIRFYNGNILFIDNNGMAHIFGKNRTVRMTEPCTVKKTRSISVRRTVPLAGIGKCGFADKRFTGVFDKGFIGEDGKMYNPDSTLFADNDACLYSEVTIDGEDFVFFTDINGELHSCRAEDYEDDMTSADDEYLPDEISGQKIMAFYHIGCGDDEGAVALDDNGNIYSIGYPPLCVDEFFVCTDNISVISIDSADDETYCCVGLGYDGRLKLWTGDCDEDEDYRDFFTAIRYITDVVDFDINGTVGAAVNSKGKIQLWGEPDLIKAYEALIPDEFLEF